MIAIQPNQLRVLDAYAREAFASSVTKQLYAAYATLFNPLPFALAKRMVAAKIEYAEERYEITFQSALTTYLHYCCAIGAHFDQQPEVQALLDDTNAFPDDIPDQLAAKVTEKAWQQAQEAALLYDWLEALPLTDRVAARYCWSLHQDKLIDRSEAAIQQHITQAITLAKPLSITDDAGLTAFAVCQTKLGRDFYTRHATPWTSTVFNDSEILPALRGMTLAGCASLEWNIAI